VVRVTDNGTPALFATISFQVTVTNVVPTIALSGAATITAGATYTLTLGTVTDPGADTVTSYIVNWGDGTSDSYTVNGEVTHVYANAGNYVITVDLVDEDGTHVSAGTLNVTVAEIGAPRSVYIPTDIAAAAAGNAFVPVMIDDATGLAAVRLEIGFDPTRLSVVEVRLGTLLNGFTGEIVVDPAGVITIIVARGTALPGGDGALVEIEFARQGRVGFVTPIDLRQAVLESIDGTPVSLQADPMPGPDATDGSVVFQRESGQPPSRPPGLQPGDPVYPFVFAGSGASSASLVITPAYLLAVQQQLEQGYAGYANGFGGTSFLFQVRPPWKDAIADPFWSLASI
jgi:PKD repeat protein